MAVGDDCTDAFVTEDFIKVSTFILVRSENVIGKYSVIASLRN